MFQIKRILFPVDFSPRVRRAVAYVEALAGRFDAEVILLHVIEPPTYNSFLGEEPVIEPAQFDKFFGAELKYLRLQRLVEHGEVARQIVDCAARLSVDLIMMPTQGLGTFRRLILGSSTAKVLHDAEHPVWDLPAHASVRLKVRTSASTMNSFHPRLQLFLAVRIG